MKSKTIDELKEFMTKIFNTNKEIKMETLVDPQPEVTSESIIESITDRFKKEMNKD